MIQTVKHNEQLRKEYRILPAVLMDAFDEGKAEGEAHGKSLGLAEGSRQAKLETARNLRAMGLSNENIAQATGLSKTEVAALK